MANSDDFRDLAAEEALQDLQLRIEHYEKIYETVREAEGAYIKIFNLRAKVHACNVYGRMVKTVLPYLMAIHSHPRPIFMIAVGTGDEDSSSLFAPSASERLLAWARELADRHTLLTLTSTQPSAVSIAEQVAALHLPLPPPPPTSPYLPLSPPFSLFLLPSPSASPCAYAADFSPFLPLRRSSPLRRHPNQ